MTYCACFAFTTATCTQGCVLSPLLYSNTVIKFVDDTSVVSLITGNDEKVYLKDVEGLTHPCGLSILM